MYRNVIDIRREVPKDVLEKISRYSGQGFQ